MGFSSVSNQLWPKNQHELNWKIENHTTNLSKSQSTCHTFFENIHYLSRSTHCELQLSFPLKQIHLPEPPELAAWAVACSVLLKQSKGDRKKNKNLSSEGRFQQSDLPFEETARSLRRARRQVEPRLCLHQQLTSRWSLTPLWTLFELPWQLLWYETLPSPPDIPVQNFCHASQSGQLLMETMFLSGMWQRDGGMCRLDASGMGGFPLWILPVQYEAARNHTGRWCGSCCWERFDGPVIITINTQEWFWYYNCVWLIAGNP